PQVAPGDGRSRQTRGLRRGEGENPRPCLKLDGVGPTLCAALDKFVNQERVCPKQRQALFTVSKNMTDGHISLTYFIDTQVRLSYTSCQQKEILIKRLLFRKQDKNG
ncbi:MAG: hypothetical protein JW950_10675, partial [Deltaproteobacteria bacterium]|nr:hypothetical protein [Deltaproteobacteria bacterium]